MVFIEKPKSRIVGVKPVVADKVYGMLQGGQRHFGVSGAYMSHQAFNPDYVNVEGHDTELVKGYLEGIRETSAVIKRWVRDKPNAVVLESLRVPGAVEPNRNSLSLQGYSSDCAVVFGNEVVLINTYRWKKKKRYSVGDNGNALMTEKEFPEGSINMSEPIDKWLDYLDEDTYITGIVCVNQEGVTVTRNRNWYTADYRLVEIDRFEELMNEKYESIDDDDKSMISSSLVSALVVKLQKPFDLYEKVFAMNSLRDFR